MRLATACFLITLTFGIVMAPLPSEAQQLAPPSQLTSGSGPSLPGALQSEMATAQHDLQQMIAIAITNGGVDREAEIAAAKHHIEALNLQGRLVHGARKPARDANTKGLGYLQSGQVAEALRAFEAAYQADPADVEILENVGYAHLRQGDPDTAEPWLLRALALAPGRASVWANLGQVYARQGNRAAAVACLAHAYRFSRRQDTTRQFFGRLLEDADAHVREAAEQVLQLRLVQDGKNDAGPIPVEELERFDRLILAQSGKRFPDLALRQKAETLEKIYQSRERPVLKVIALQRLGELKDPESASVITSALEDQNPWVQLEAIKAAGFPHNAQALPTLEKLLQELALPAGVGRYTGGMTSIAAAVRKAPGLHGLVIDSQLTFEGQELQGGVASSQPGDSDLYIPDQGIAYMAIDNLEETRRLLQATPLLQELQRLTFWEDLQAAEILGYPRLTQFQLHRAFRFLQAGLDLMQLIGKTLRIVFYPAAGPSYDILLAGSIDIKTKAAEKLITLAHGLGLTLAPIQHEEYEGVRITSLKLPGRQQPLHYLYFDDRLFASSSQQILKNVVDLKQRRLSNALAFDPDFLQARSALPAGAVFVYLRRDFSSEGVRAYAQRKLRRAVLESIAAITGKDLDSIIAEKGFRREPAKQPASSAAYPESIQEVLGFVSKEASALGIINRYDGYLRYMASLGAAGEKLVSTLVRALGIAPDGADVPDLDRDLFSLYDKNRLFVVYKGLKTSGGESFPSLVLGLKLLDPDQDAGKGLLRAFLRDTYDTVEEIYHTVPIINFQTEHGFAPAYARVGGYLLIGSEPEILKDVIDTHSGLSPALVDYERYTALQAAIGEEVSDVMLYLNPERTLSSVEEQLRFLATRGGPLRFNRLDVQQKIAPLFGTLGRLEVVGGRMQQRGNAFEGRWLLLLRE